MNASIQYDMLTQDQRDIANLGINQNILFTGDSSSGRTTTLLARAHVLANRLSAGPSQYRILFSGKTTPREISAMVARTGIPREVLLTYDEWCEEYCAINDLGTAPIPTLDQRKRKELDARILTHLKRTKAAPLYRFVMVDDLQEFDPIAAEILMRIASHVTLTGDTADHYEKPNLTEFEIRMLFAIPGEIPTLT